MPMHPRVLVGKVEAQGWRIESKKDGWMCWPPDKSKPGVMIHRSPSDEHWHKMAIRRLKLSGYKPD